MSNIKNTCLFIGGFLLGMFATAFVKWPPKDSSSWASWVQAVGAMIAIAIAIYVPYRQRMDGDKRDRKRDNLRRQESLMTLRPIMERALNLIENIPRNEATDIYVEHFFKHISDTDALATIHRSLGAFPVERLIDYQAIQSVFEMQDALKIAHDTVSDINAEGLRAAAWDISRRQVEEAVARAHVAKSQFKAALDSAGVTNYVSASGTATMELNIRQNDV